MLVEMALPFRGQTKTRDSSSERVYPPMIIPKGVWTTDGMHPNSRGWNEVLKVCGNIAPETFVL
jgi:hypothetical protein